MDRNYILLSRELTVSSGDARFARKKESIKTKRRIQGRNTLGHHSHRLACIYWMRLSSLAGKQGLIHHYI